MKDLIKKDREEKLIKYLEDNLRQYLTKKEWEKMLPKYVDNYMRGYSVRDQEIFDSPNDPQTIIGGGFNWASTLEPNYWSKMWDKVMERASGTRPF
jgi:hypothetical protein